MYRLIYETVAYIENDLNCLGMLRDCLLFVKNYTPEHRGMKCRAHYCSVSCASNKLEINHSKKKIGNMTSNGKRNPKLSQLIRANYIPLKIDDHLLPCFIRNWYFSGVEFDKTAKFVANVMSNNSKTRSGRL